MKKLICLTLLLSFFAGMNLLFAQVEGDTTQYLLTEKTVLSGFGGPFVEFSSLNKQFAVCLGGGAAMIINQTLFIGGYFEGIVTNHYMKDIDTTIVQADKPKIAFEHGGIWLGYVYKPKKAIHGGLSMKLGWGEIDLKEGEGNPYSDYDYRDRIFPIQPQAEMEFNMTDWFKINVGVGYRIVTGIDATYPVIDDDPVNFYEKNDFNSFVGTITLIFGGNEKKK